MASSAPPTVRNSPAPSAAPSMAGSTKSTETTTSLPSATTDKTAEDSGKLKAFLGILRNFIGVKDIAAVRFSLPAQLLEPTPNLEYWNYLDRPDTFVSIGDSDDELGRMLEVLRFWFTKDLKYVKGKPCKPYNSVLGEFFRCNWEAEDTLPPAHGTGKKISVLNNQPTDNKPVKVSFLTEQTSHHPPVSAFWIECAEKGISARGFDQLSAKFTGTSIRVTPGNHNLGIFINLKNRDNEEYQLTHPAAHLGGLLRGALAVSVADTCYVTCPKNKIKAILHYAEEGWLGKSQNRVSGVIFRYNPEKDTTTKLKDVSDKDIIAKVEGCWHEKIYYTLAGEKEKKDSKLLVDLEPLWPAAKIIPPEVDQLPNESKKYWNEVTQSILNKDYGQATKFKQEIEEKQRQKATERKEQGVEWQPRFFKDPVDPSGIPSLTVDGVTALKGLLENNFQLQENAVLGA